MKILALLICLFLTGCDRIAEDIKRGTPGSENYIAEDYQEVTIIQVHEGKFIEVKNGTAIIQPYTVVEDNKGIRYKVGGVIGEIGDKFVKDVSLDTEI